MTTDRESPIGYLSQQPCYAIARRTATLVSRGLSDLEQGLISSVSQQLIATGNIFEAIERQDVEAVRLILKRDPGKANVRETDDEGAVTPLYAATRMMSNTESCSSLQRIVHMLIDFGADVRAQCNGGDTALHGAVCTRAPQAAEVVELLFGAGSDVNAVDSDALEGRLPIHHCWRADVAKLLVEHGTRLDHEDDEGNTPLRVQCERGNAEVAAVLLAAGDDPFQIDSLGRTLIHGCGDADTARLLVNHHIDPHVADRNGETPLHAAAGSRNVEVAEFLLSIGADRDAVDSRGRCALHYALNGLNAKICMRRTYRDCRPVDPAPFVETVRCLLEADADPNIPLVQTVEWQGLPNSPIPFHRGRVGDTPLHLAAGIGEVALVDVLLADPRTDIDLQNERGQTPLHIAAAEGHLSIAEALIAAGADVSLQTLDGLTPRELAHASGHDEVANAIPTRIDDRGEIDMTFLKMVGDLAKLHVEYGTLKFEEFVRDVVDAIGEEATRRFHRYAEIGWDAARELNPDIEPTGSVLTILDAVRGTTEQGLDTTVRPGN